MPTEMGAEAVEIITMAVDKFQAKKNYEVRALVRCYIQTSNYLNHV